MVGAVPCTHQDIERANSVAVAGEPAVATLVVASGGTVAPVAAGAGLGGVVLGDVGDLDAGFLCEVALLASTGPLGQASALVASGAFPGDLAGVLLDPAYVPGDHGSGPVLDGEVSGLAGDLVVDVAQGLL